MSSRLIWTMLGDGGVSDPSTRGISHNRQKKQREVAFISSFAVGPPLRGASAPPENQGRYARRREVHEWRRRIDANPGRFEPHPTTRSTRGRARVWPDADHSRLLHGCGMLSWSQIVRAWA